MSCVSMQPNRCFFSREDVWYSVVFNSIAGNLCVCKSYNRKPFGISIQYTLSQQVNGSGGLGVNALHIIRILDLQIKSPTHIDSSRDPELSYTRS